MESRHVSLHGRRFVIRSDDDGPRIIYERVLHMPGHPYLERYYLKGIWHRNHHAISTFIQEILDQQKS